MKKIMTLIIGIYILVSCSDKVIEEPIGYADDTIKLSIKNVDFTAQVDSITITTEGNWWWINEISFEDSTYIYSNRDDINLESDSYSIKEEHFVVERRDKNTLFVKITENDTRKERQMNITLQAGNYFDYVLIKQPIN